MTALASSRTVKRETGTYSRGRALMVELHPGYLTLRRKGTRAAVSVDYAAIYDLGWKMIARAKALEKAEARRAKKKGDKRR